MKALAPHEKSVIADLERLMDLRQQSPIDLARDFRRIVSRIETADYGALGRLELLRTALDVNRVFGQTARWECRPLLGILETEGLLPRMSTEEVSASVCSALHAPGFSAQDLGWLLDRGVSPDTARKDAMGLRFLSVMLGQDKMFEAIWERSPNPSPPAHDGIGLLSYCVMRLASIEAGMWKRVHDAGARFHEADPEGRTPAERFAQLCRFPGMGARRSLDEVAVAIDAEKLALDTAASSSKSPRSRL